MRHYNMIIFVIFLIVFQAIRDEANRAAQELSSASSEKAKAEAEIAMECIEALQKAVA